MFLWVPSQEFLCDAWVCDKFTPYILVTIMIRCSGFGNAVGCVKSAASDDTKEIKSLCGCLMGNNAAFYGGRLWLKPFVRFWSDMWKYIERKFAVIFYVPLMCCEYRYVLLLTRVQPIQRAEVSCDSAFNGSKDAFCIQLSALELSVSSKICEPCPIFWIVMYIDISDARNSNRSSASFMFRYDVILHLRAKPLLL